MTELLFYDFKSRQDYNVMVQRGLDMRATFECNYDDESYGYGDDPADIISEVYFDYDSLTKGEKISLRALGKRLGAKCTIQVNNDADF